MKKQLLVLCATAALVVGCNQADQGGVGTESETTIDRSTPSSATNYDSGSLTNTNRIDQQQQPQTPQQTPSQTPSQPQQGAQPQQGTTP